MRLGGSSVARRLLLPWVLASCLVANAASQTHPARAASAFRGNAQHTGAFDAPGVPQLNGLAWKFRVEGRGGAPPAVADDIVCAGRGVYPGLVAVNARTGQKLWEFASGVYAASPVVEDGAVFAAYGNGGKEIDGFRGGFRAIDLKTGKEKWNRRTTSDTERNSPTVHAGTVYLVSHDAVVWALDARTGKEKWQFRFLDEAAPMVTSPTLDNGTIYFGAAGHYQGKNAKPYLYAVDAETGREKWKVSIPSEPGRSTSGSVKMLDAPAVAQNTIYLGSDSNRLYALDAKSGALKWSFEAGGRVTSPAVGEGLVFFGSNDRFLHALDSLTGREKWKIATDGNGVSVPSVARGVVYFGGGATPKTGLGNYVYAVDAASGAVKWKFETDQPSPGRPNMERWPISAPTIVGDSLYFTCWTMAYRLR